MEEKIQFYNGVVEVDTIEECDEVIITKTMTKEEYNSKYKYINNEQGVIAIDINGHKIYEDIIHPRGEGRARYYIQTAPIDCKYIVPEREDIPKNLWGMKVQCRWIEFSIE